MTYTLLRNGDVVQYDTCRTLVSISNRIGSGYTRIEAVLQASLPSDSVPRPGHQFHKVLSLNGFHAVPDEEAAYQEIYRVLHPGGTF